MALTELQKNIFLLTSLKGYEMSFLKKLAREFKQRNNYIVASALVACESTFAQSASTFSLPFLNQLGCQLFSFFTGSLAIWAFILVAASVLLIGLLAKIDFAKLVGAVVIFGLIQGLGTLLANSSSKFSSMSCIVSSGT